MNVPHVSIAAVTYRDLEQTRAFVDSVYACTQEPFEFIMVSNGCAPELLNYLKTQEATRGNFILHKNAQNLGIGPAMSTAMSLCTTPYIFRCDSDIEIKTAYWTKFMCEIADAYPEVGAVGTAITGGVLIKREGYTETDLCLSNCMLIHRRAMEAIDRKMKAELPRISAKISELIKLNVGRYDGYFNHLGNMLNEMHYDGGRWARAYPYGTDDFHYSMLVRYAGLRIAKDYRVNVLHKDASLSPAEPSKKDNDRDRKVNIGFQYWRTFWELMEDFHDIKSLDYPVWPMNQAYREEARRLQNA